MAGVSTKSARRPEADAWIRAAARPATGVALAEEFIYPERVEHCFGRLTPLDGPVTKEASTSSSAPSTTPWRSQRSIRIGEWTHIVFKAKDVAYLCREAEKLHATSAMWNADSYRCWVESAALGVGRGRLDDIQNERLGR